MMMNSIDKIIEIISEHHKYNQRKDIDKKPEFIF